MLIQEITSANAPKAIGPYTPAVKLSDFVYMSMTALRLKTQRLRAKLRTECLSLP